ncbi:ABC transporter ATP-binding protein [Pseudogemmobacter faecipullorum]|uniref:ABC transporter ATP-binding protein n=1 Tax=Pseudogemmobacter faecipullorum TaxID=2755041 RepID=A0ABS8CJD6_9RHOB|nr:ABC transporter ATP-binding protein [Pseudogemmobacter faecipullorum]MCB5409489.1 ABC transporter ATP-binding protein [Pseudogemmobacter faecipullorum]
MTDQPLLSIRHLTRQFPGSPRPAVSNLSFEIAPGEILALIGPSGCGKTTSLRMIAGFQIPDEGRILLSGRDITRVAPEKRGIGMVFQDYALFPHMTVGENVMFGARAASARWLGHWLELVGLQDYADRYPDELSGGQQQRVALARSFAAEPGLILLDEPFSNLDAALRAQTRREIRRLLKSTGIGILLVTHDQEEAMSFADRIAVMQGGVLQQIGTAAEVYDRPVNAFVAGFLGRTNLLKGAARGDLCQTPLGALPLARPAEGEVQLSLRPEMIRLTPAPEAEANGRITSVEFRGHDVTYWVDCSGLELQVDAMGGPRLCEGAPVLLQIEGRLVPLG